MSHLPLDDNLFDRLADGELADQERRELLSSLDHSRDGWRRCALALLEAQAWRKQFNTLVRTEAPPTVVQVAAAAPSQLPARPVRWLALAACLLLAFGLGWKLHPQQQLDDFSGQIATSVDNPENQGEFPLQEFPVEDVLDPQDAVTLVVRDVEGRNQRVRLPLLEGAEVGNPWAQARYPEELRAGLKTKGLDLRNKRRFAPLFFEQNEGLVPMVIPVDDTYVVPVNRPVY